MDYPYQIPRYVHRAGAAQLVSTEAACEAALADGWEIHPSRLAPVDVEVVAPVAIADPAIDVVALTAPDTDAAVVIVPATTRKRRR